LCIEPHNDGFEETFKFVYPSLAIPADVEELVIRFHEGENIEFPIDVSHGWRHRRT